MRSCRGFMVSLALAITMVKARPHSTVSRHKPATAKSGAVEGLNHVRVLPPTGPFASANADMGIRQRRALKLADQKGPSSLSSRALLTGWA